MTRIYLYPFLLIIAISLFFNNAYAQNCPSLNVVGSFNNIVSWPTSYATAQSDGHCLTFTPPYPPTLCFEYQVPYSDTVLFSLHLNACGGTISINTGNYGGGCSSINSGNSTFTGTATYDANCNLIGNAAYVGYCGGAVSGDILTICFNINTSTVCEPITICPTAFCGASSCKTTLPISLMSFEGKCLNGSYVFNWVTSSEINNDYFTIEQSSGGIVFYPIAEIAGAGNSNQILSYEHQVLTENTDETAYFRLKQSDFDGSFSYSDIIAVTCQNKTDIIIYPNPAKDEVSIQLSQNIKAYTIKNYLGQVVFHQNNLAVKKTIIDASSLAKGMYIIEVETEIGEYFNEKLIIKN